MQGTTTLGYFIAMAEAAFGKHSAVLNARIARLANTAEREPWEIECIRAGGVYLGSVYHTPFTVNSGKMLEYIRADALTWSPSTYSVHPLKRFFAPREGRPGYAVIRGFAIAVDHIVPTQMGGLDHPRNYALMSQSLNSSFGGGHLEEKAALVGLPQMRQAFKFAQDAKKAAAQAVASWLTTLQALPGATTLSK